MDRETETFLNAVDLLKKEFAAYEDFDVDVTPDPYHTGNYHVVKLTYGELHTEFTTCGYNFAYNMQRLFNNEVVNKMLR